MKTWVWLVVLVVIIGIVAFFITRGDEKKEAGDTGGAPDLMRIDENDLKFGQNTYDGICAMLSRQSTERGQYERMERTAEVVGYGTVLNVTQPEPGTLEFEVDADPPDGQVEVRVDVSADKYTGEAPAAGQYVKYAGFITNWEWHGETGKVDLWTARGYVSLAKAE